ncbi:MAG: bifunctional UDP-3-O-[3-hydroxymyristoyl] N-acetylglucosamine deacetylase/3-hydroxyacyl-ACP dehydratase [Longimicrobiales bacterium]
MSHGKQQTISKSVSVEGIGVHSGAPAVLSFQPAEADAGVRFRRTDLEGTPEIPVDLDHVCGTDLGTSLGKGEVRVMTVEHVMAALSARRIDNVTLELSGPEPPILDGSFQGYLDVLDEAGVVEQDAPRNVLEISDPVTVKLDSGEFYVAAPGEGLRISATIEFEHLTIGRQFGTFFFGEESFIEEIARARTFGFKADAEALHARGLARGASLENTVVLDENGVMNDELRFPDEFLRHKVGDMVGDLGLLGADLNVHIVAERPSHQGNVELARALKKAAARGRGEPIVDAQKIMEYLPHRFPMLLVDRIVEVDSGKRIVGIKNVTINEPFFQGHFPGHPIMPGVLIIEAMGQVGGLLLMDAVEKPEDYVVYFMALDNVKWRRPVVPGDQIVFELEMVQFRRHVCRMKGRGLVDGQVVAEADLMARIVER